MGPPASDMRPAGGRYPRLALGSEATYEALWIGVILVVGGRLVARSPAGVRLGNELRALSDRVMLGALRLTSEFEREL